MINGCKVITTKWFDINKVNDATPNLRAGLVGRELKLDNRLELFAATPLLEALRLICAICTNKKSRDNPFRILSMDVRHANFHAKVSKPIYIEISAFAFMEPGTRRSIGQLSAQAICNP